MICPRCKVNELNPIPTLNSLSRRDNDTYICNDCGVEESLIDLFGEEEDLSWLDEKKREG